MDTIIIVITVETLGSFHQWALEFLSELDRLMSIIVGDRRETAFLSQRLSIRVQPFNLITFKDTFPTDTEDKA